MSFLWCLATLIWKPKPLIPIEDRLSALPDSILCHILSFLTTKDSAATSILSKRWNSLWLSVFTIDLVANKLSDIKTFDSVILLRDIKVPIQKLRLKYNARVKRLRYDVDVLISQYCRDHINPLITAAFERGLETLELDMQLAPLCVQFASGIFSCKTLTVLKLRHLKIVIEDLPRINTSPLKTLHLDHVTFRCHTHIINFLLSFPTLEELQANVVGVRKFFQQKETIKCSPNLIRASVSDSEAISLFLLSKAVTLTINLTSTYLMRIEHTWFRFPTFHNLTQIELVFKYDSKKKWRWMLEMLHQSPKLQHLIINEKMEYGDGEDNWQDPTVVPECLSSQLKTCLIRNCRGQKSDLQFAEFVMRNSKVLRTMTIHSSCSILLKAKFMVLHKLSPYPRNCKLIFE
ncbi:unnamed protein product [Vicia faba]|uniref:F-box domain-containing protein n=1 Tax=Vicia faba TaxID=3906 RepID=A0AAV1AJF4_VICFA|nr:unnamed protein product [Vicia faba]